VLRVLFLAALAATSHPGARTAAATTAAPNSTRPVDIASVGCASEDNPSPTVPITAATTPPHSRYKATSGWS